MRVPGMLTPRHVSREHQGACVPWGALLVACVSLVLVHVQARLCAALVMLAHQKPEACTIPGACAILDASNH